jgi:hypothetical protein
LEKLGITLYEPINEHFCLLPYPRIESLCGVLFLKRLQFKETLSLYRLRELIGKTLCLSPWSW